MPESTPANASRIACDHGLRRQAIVGTLLADIFEGRLVAGRRLVTQELAARFGVSHTPIREALVKLEGLGVVDLQPNRGGVVRRVTPREVTEVCRVRRLLECEAVRRACGRMGPDELAELAGLFRRNGQDKDLTSGDPAAFIGEARALDDRLHDRIAAACGNAFLAQELTRLKALFRAFRDAAWARVEAKNDYRRLAEESREHLTIVEAMAAGDGRSASRAMGAHIMNGSRYWGRVLSENQDAASREVGSAMPTNDTPARPRAGHSKGRTAC